MDVNAIMQYVMYALALVGVMACVVSVITQVVKSWPGLENLPTAMVVIVLSLVLCPLAYAFWTWYSHNSFELPLAGLCIIVGFFVALVAMDGWERVSEIWQRTKYSNRNE
ncbi:hypothetical protein [Brotaphodocola sp.]|uniref:hypothetical protein n=1 Tax=Brotaphodocola sp. TaxID=3073577 RepID=UPI003D7D5D46